MSHRGLNPLRSRAGRKRSPGPSNAEVEMPIYMDIHEIKGRYGGSGRRRRTALDLESRKSMAWSITNTGLTRLRQDLLPLRRAEAGGGGVGAPRSARVGRGKDHRGRTRDRGRIPRRSRVNSAGGAINPGGNGEPARPGDPDRTVYRYRRLDRAHATPRGRNGNGSFPSCTTNRPRRLCANLAAARSSAPETASWRASFRCRCGALRHPHPGPFAQHAREGAASRSRFGLARRKESLSTITWICSDRPSSSRRGCAHAQPEQSLVSNVVAELCIGKGLAFQDLGEVSLKDFERPIRVHAIQQPGEGSGASTSERTCGAFVHPSQADAEKLLPPLAAKAAARTRAGA